MHVILLSESEMETEEEGVRKNDRALWNDRDEKLNTMCACVRVCVTFSVCLSVFLSYSMFIYAGFENAPVFDSPKPVYACIY